MEHSADQVASVERTVTSEVQNELKIWDQTDSECFYAISQAMPVLSSAKSKRIIFNFAI